jgi:hypothetical protein
MFVHYDVSLVGGCLGRREELRGGRVLISCYCLMLTVTCANMFRADEAKLTSLIPIRYQSD